MGARLTKDTSNIISHLFALSSSLLMFSFSSRIRSVSWTSRSRSAATTTISIIKTEIPFLRPRPVFERFARVLLNPLSASPWPLNKGFLKKRKLQTIAAWFGNFIWLAGRKSFEAIWKLRFHKFGSFPITKRTPHCHHTRSDRCLLGPVDQGPHLLNPWVPKWTWTWIDPWDDGPAILRPEHGTLEGFLWQCDCSLAAALCCGDVFNMWWRTYEALPLSPSVKSRFYQSFVSLLLWLVTSLYRLYLIFYIIFYCKNRS